MELDSRKKSRRDRTMRSKSFDTQAVRDRPERGRRVERSSHLLDGNNIKCLPDGKKGMRKECELREVVSGSATQGLWLRNGKVGSQVSGIDQSLFPGRRTV